LVDSTVQNNTILLSVQICKNIVLFWKFSLILRSVLGSYPETGALVAVGNHVEHMLTSASTRGSCRSGVEWSAKANVCWTRAPTSVYSRFPGEMGCGWLYIRVYGIGWCWTGGNLIFVLAPRT